MSGKILPTKKFMISVFEKMLYETLEQDGFGLEAAKVFVSTHKENLRDAADMFLQDFNGNKKMGDKQTFGEFFNETDHGEYLFDKISISEIFKLTPKVKNAERNNYIVVHFWSEDPMDQIGNTFENYSDAVSFIEEMVNDMMIEVDPDTDFKVGKDTKWDIDGYIIALHSVKVE